MERFTDALEYAAIFRASQHPGILPFLGSFDTLTENDGPVNPSGFSWQLAQRGKLLPITALGGAPNTSGRGDWHRYRYSFTRPTLDRILAWTLKQEFVTLEPGISFHNLQQPSSLMLVLASLPGYFGYADWRWPANTSVGEKIREVRLYAQHNRAP